MFDGVMPRERKPVARRPHWHYPHEPEKFNAATAMLSAAEKGAYIILLNLMYMRGGPIDNDANRLPGTIGCTKQAYRKILDRLIYFGKIEVTSGGRLTNAKAERVMAARCRVSV